MSTPDSGITPAVRRRGLIVVAAVGLVVGVVVTSGKASKAAAVKPFRVARQTDKLAEAVAAEMRTR